MPTEREGMWKGKVFWNSLQGPPWAKAPGHGAVPSTLPGGAVSGPVQLPNHPQFLPISSILREIWGGNTVCRPWPIRTTGSWSELRSSPNQQCKQWLQHRYKFCIERNHSLKFWNIFLNMICDRAADVPHMTVSSMVWRLSGFCLAAQTSTHVKYPDSCPSPWLTRHRSFITKQ